MKNKNVIYLLESVDLINYRGVLKTKPELPKNAPWTTINVSISGLLKSRIEKSDMRDLMVGDSYVGTKFCCQTDSKSFADNPFKLVEFIPKGDSDIPRNYRLELVNQRRGVLEEFSDMFNNKFEQWHNKKMMVSSKYFRRYERIETDAKLSELEFGVVTP